MIRNHPPFVITVRYIIVEKAWPAACSCGAKYFKEIACLQIVRQIKACARPFIEEGPCFDDAS